MGDGVLFLVVYVILCGVISLLAQARGGNAVQWFFIPMLVTPVIAFLAIVLFPLKKDAG